MLHILLGILKIIGIVLAVIIGIVLLVVFVVLFAGLRYKMEAAANGDFKSLYVKVKFSWLFHLISGFVTYQEENIEWQIKIAWKKFNASKEEMISEKIEDIEDIEEAEHAEETVKDIENAESNAVRETEETVDFKEQQNNSKKHERNYSFQRIFDKIKEIIAVKEKIAAFCREEVHKKALLKLKREAIRFLKKLEPKKLRANVEFGFEDPYKTGSALAYLSMLYPFYGDNINIVPDFTEKILKGDIFIKGTFRLSYLMSVGIYLIIDKNVRLTIKEIKKLIAKK